MIRQKKSLLKFWAILFFLTPFCKKKTPESLQKDFVAKDNTGHILDYIDNKKPIYPTSCPTPQQIVKAVETHEK